MDAVRELLTTPFGLMSLGTIVFVIVMGAYIAAWVKKQVANDAEPAQRRS